jgi:uncharacterized protein YjbI with pentapeptide repeats
LTLLLLNVIIKTLKKKSVKENKMIEIKNRWANKVIYTYQGDSLVEANLSGANLSRADLSRANLSRANLSRAYLSGANLYLADLSRANLSRANLSWADLSEANLSWADLSGANLYRANLSEANLSRADLSWANLSEANLSRADLSRADLSRADLSEANLYGANLSRAKLFETNLYGTKLSGADLKDIINLSPVYFLLADWGEVSDELCTELMRYDAANHPNPELFLEWARNDGSCSYSGISIERAANFKEKKSLYSPGPSKSAYELMKMVIRERCKGE